MHSPVALASWPTASAWKQVPGNPASRKPAPRKPSDCAQHFSDNLSDFTSMHYCPDHAPPLPSLSSLHPQICILQRLSATPPIHHAMPRNKGGVSASLLPTCSSYFVFWTTDKSALAQGSLLHIPLQVCC